MYIFHYLQMRYILSTWESVFQEVIQCEAIEIEQVGALLLLEFKFSFRFIQILTREIQTAIC